MNSLLLIKIIGFCTIFATSQGLTEDTLKHCCDLGTNYANKNDACGSPIIPLLGVNKDDEPFCLNIVQTCCKSRMKEKDCELGLEDAQSDVCPAPAGTERKDCCEACKFGKMAKSSKLSCNNAIGLAAPYDQRFKECCEEDKKSGTTLKPPTTPLKISTVSKNDPLPAIENFCEIDGLCAQICIPTADSYICDCNPGYSLMADNISCKEIKAKPTGTKKNNSCEMNNPCEHNCVDTGVAIHCTCRDGYQLANDKSSCIDIDECARGYHTCREDEYCVNGEGFYDCVTDGDYEDIYSAECPIGLKYNFEKKSCDDINECEIPLICPPSQKCINTIGSFECQGEEITCPTGYYYKSATNDCEDIDECITGQNDCNRESQVCLNTKGNFTCVDKASTSTCPPGFKMNPLTKHCQDIDECYETPDLCAPDELCVNEPGGHSCVPQGSSSSSYKPKIPSYSNNIPKPQFIPETTPRKPLATTKLVPTISTTTTTTTTTSTTPKVTSVVTTPSTTLITTPKTTLKTILSTAQTPAVSTTPHLSSRYYPQFVPSPRPIPEYVKPYRPQDCSKGYHFDTQLQQCIDVDECLDDNVCDNYQECYNTPGSYICNCKPGFSRDQTTGACADINECQIGQDDCAEGQRCDNSIGSFICSRVAGCGTGYTLNYASGLCEDDDECALGTHNCNLLGANLVCKNTYGSYRCERIRVTTQKPYQPKPHYDPYPQNRPFFTNYHTYQISRQPTYPNYTIYSSPSKKCLPGYIMDISGNCQDINECESNPCLKSEKCINLRGRYQCISNIECKGGFELNEEGDGCVDVNECTRGTHACLPSQICKNYVGYHVCSCKPGHKLVNNECVDINECDLYKDRKCSSTSYCINTIGSFKCVCKEGFREENGRCIDIDECQERNNLCHQKCINFWGGYRCSCDRGFQLSSDNRTCNDIDECDIFKDKHICIGECENIPGSYVCRCPPGYKLGTDGYSCQDIDECTTQQPCHGKDQICFNTRGSYECPAIICPPNYYKDPDHKSRCKREAQCAHLGSCSQSPEQYTYHFLTLISNLPLTQGPVKFFQMKGPMWDASSARFKLSLENVKCPQHIKKVDQSYFSVNRETKKADISFMKSIEGPQEIELSFEMELYSENFYTTRVVSKIFIYVSQYTF